MRINKKESIKENLASREDATTNYEGGQSFQLTAPAELYQRVASYLFGEPKFYSKLIDEEKETKGIVDEAHQSIVDLINKVAQTEPEFVLKLAYYSRQELYLRTVSIILLVEAANIKECKPFIRKYTPLIIQRADELAEAVAYQYSRFGRKPNLPKALQRGLGDAFSNFDEYQLAKYDRKGRVKLKDVLRLTHPTPADDKRSDLYKRLLTNELAIPDTWEVVISTKGSNRETWESIMPKMGYMAKLRNLRNFLQKDCDVSGVLSDIASKEQVLRSKQFPFRFLSAYKEIQSLASPMTGATLNALNDAMEHSIANVPTLKGVTFMSADESGSMSSKLSEKSSMSYYETANTLMAMANNFCEHGITSVFGQNFAIVQLPKHNIVTAAQDIYNWANTHNIGHSTNGYLTIKYLLEKSIKVDRIMLFTDCELYNDNGWGSDSSETVAELYRKYKRQINPNAKLYVFNLAGYGDSKFPEGEPGVALINGWSDKVFKFIEVFEKSNKQAIDEIRGLNIDEKHIIQAE